MIDQHDEKQRRCPMLGHDILFSYCRSPGRDYPCAKIYDCWWDKFDIKAFMAANYSAEDIQRVLQPKPAKVLSLLEIIQNAQKRKQEGKS
jgi:hypothetical protein